jgi:hypothetical protein
MVPSRFFFRGGDMMTQIHHKALLSSVLSLFSAACTMGATDDQTYQPGDKETVSNADHGMLRVTSMTSTEGDPDCTDPIRAVTTECGDVVGVHIKVTDADGTVQTCDQLWADVVVNGEYAEGASGDHYIADCIFTGPAGVWTVNKISAIDSGLNPLSCCTSTFEKNVTVDQSQTTEVGGLIQCTTEQSGALDIYVTINTPPDIEEVTISPSKFGETCSVITMTATASDPQNDAITYDWSVLQSPSGATYDIDSVGSTAWFAAATLGDYTIRLVVSDELDASHYLDFPLHIVEDDLGTTCDVNALVEAAH